MSDLISENLNMIFKTPKGETVHALKDLNFTIKKGELLTVLGPSGCGKTTLLNITAGFIRPTSGKITLSGNEINNHIKKWLASQGIKSNPQFSPNKKFPDCNKNVLFEKHFDNFKLIKVTCNGEKPWTIFVKTNTNLVQPKKNKVSK